MWKTFVIKVHSSFFHSVYIVLSFTYTLYIYTSEQKKRYINVFNWFMEKSLQSKGIIYSPFERLNLVLIMSNN